MIEPINPYGFSYTVVSNKECLYKTAQGLKSLDVVIAFLFFFFFFLLLNLYLVMLPATNGLSLTSGVLSPPLFISLLWIEGTRNLHEKNQVICDLLLSLQVVTNALPSGSPDNFCAENAISLKSENKCSHHI